MSGSHRPAHAWMPASPCGDRCLPRAGTLPRVGRWRRATRLGAVVAVLLGALLLAAALPLLRPAHRDRASRAWFRALLAALGVRIALRGGDRFAPPGAAVLVVSNHISWLDLVALGSVQPLRMVAKSEVGGWPLVGMLARRAGTIFLPRERLSMLPAAVASTGDALRGGAAVGVFPEGTTWCGRAGGRFRPAFFQAAVDAGAPVRPVALRYRVAAPDPTPDPALVTASDPAGETTRDTTVAAFVGSTTLWHSVFTLAGVRGLVVETRLLPLLPATTGDRRTLAVRAGHAVATCRGMPALPPSLAPALSPAPSPALTPAPVPAPALARAPARRAAVPARPPAGAPPAPPW